MSEAICDDVSVLIQGNEARGGTASCLGSHHGFGFGGEFVIDLALDAQDRRPVGFDDCSAVRRVIGHAVD